MAFSKFTIVVPSLLYVSIMHLERLASLFDVEAIICIPQSIQGPLQYSPNISYLRSIDAGQVLQRIYAINHVKTPYVLVIDDDIRISINDILSFVDKYAVLLNSFSLSVLGVQIKSHSLSYIESKSLSFLALSLLCLIENSSIDLLSRPSTLSPLFFNSHHDSSFVDRFSPSYGCYRSDWISGGFFMAPVSLFPQTSYYPFSGKAFSEDILLSYLFQLQGASLFIANGVFATTDLIQSSFTLSNFKAKIYLLRYSSVSFRIFRFLLSFLVRRLSLMSWL